MYIEFFYPGDMYLNTIEEFFFKGMFKVNWGFFISNLKL